MKLIWLLLLGMSCLIAQGQDGPAYDLQWKIGEQEELRYQFVMGEMDTAAVSRDFGALFSALSKDTLDLDPFKAAMQEMNEAVRGQEQLLSLANKGRGVVEAEIRMQPKKGEPGLEADTIGKDQMGRMLAMMLQGVMLRGSVYPEGGIHSFWVKTDQKNLLAILLELPGRPVQIGEVWPLEVNFIGNDQNFACDSAHRKNEVRLLDVVQRNGESIAILKYDLEEYVNGVFHMPAMLGGSDEGGVPTMMRYAYQGLAEFSIGRGRWVSYDGVLSFRSTGLMRSEQNQKFSLKVLEED